MSDARATAKAQPNDATPTATVRRTGLGTSAARTTSKRTTPSTENATPETSGPTRVISRDR